MPNIQYRLSKQWLLGIICISIIRALYSFLKTLPILGDKEGQKNLVNGLWGPIDMEGVGSTNHSSCWWCQKLMKYSDPKAEMLSIHVPISKGKSTLSPEKNSTCSFPLHCLMKRTCILESGEPWFQSLPDWWCKHFFICKTDTLLITSWGCRKQRVWDSTQSKSKFPSCSLTP